MNRCVAKTMFTRITLLYNLIIIYYNIYKHYMLCNIIYIFIKKKKIKFKKKKIKKNH